MIRELFTDEEWELIVNSSKDLRGFIDGLPEEIPLIMNSYTDPQISGTGNRTGLRPEKSGAGDETDRHLKTNT